MEQTIIRAKKDLYNAGLCFTKCKEYIVPKRINTAASLMDTQVINDQGEPHNIGSWWREFEIVEETKESENE